MIQKSYFILPYKLKKINFKGNASMRYPAAFAEKMILNYTKKGDKILDPFAGFGTTLFAAQKLGRVGIGIEYDQKKYNYIKQRINFPNQIIFGDSKKISNYKLPQFNLCITSPPYMRSFDQQNPFTNYAQKGNYQQYIKDIKKIYSQIKKVIKKEATIIIEVSNTFGKNNPMTPLAWDIAREISKVFFFERELIYCVKNAKLNKGIANHSYCLVFRNK